MAPAGGDLPLAYLARVSLLHHQRTERAASQQVQDEPAPA